MAIAVAIVPGPAVRGMVSGKNANFCALAKSFVDLA
jgi:hypothetical protein